MIKIHAGKYKNHYINRVKIKSTRETASLVREAVFNMINVEDKVVLDLFAGSGSYGITALSLGANNCYFIDNNKKAVLTINNNLKKLKINNNYQLYNVDYELFLKRNQTKFDVIFIDPPYNFNNYINLINTIILHLNIKGLIVLEVDNKNNLIEEANLFNIVKNKKYGNKKIIIIENN